MNKKPQLFNDIIIETSNFCNRTCNYCPVSHSPRPQGFMSNDTLQMIVQELKHIDYSDKICLNLYNEPLLDKRLCEIIACFKRNLPKTTIYFASNGDFLTLELFRNLIKSGLSHIWLTSYDKNNEQSLREMYRRLNKEERQRLNIRFFPEHKFLDCRAGSLPELCNKVLRQDCFRVNHQICVNWVGQIILCCNDYYATFVLGNIGRDKLLDVWNSDKIEYVRENLRRKDRSVISLCKQCNAPYDTPKSYFFERLAWSAKWLLFPVKKA